MEKFCTFVEDQTSKSLEISKIPIIYYSDPFLRAKKRLGSLVELKKASGAEGKPGSPPTSTEVIAAKEAAEKVQQEVEEEEEGHEAPVVRKSKRLTRGKANVIIPASSKRKKDLPKLDEIPRKRRKFLDASTTAAAKVCSSSISLVSLLIVVVPSASNCISSFIICISPG